MDYTASHCRKLVYWTQKPGTNICWFISILITVFYSQLNRAILYQKARKWKHSLAKKDFNVLREYGEEFRFDHVDEFLDSWDFIKHSEDEKLIQSSKRLFTVQLYNLFRHIMDFKYMESDNAEKDHSFFEKYNTIYVLKLLNIIDDIKFPFDKFTTGFDPKNYIKAFYDFLHIESLMVKVTTYNQQKIICYDVANDGIEIIENRVVRYTYYSEDHVKIKLSSSPDILIVNCDENYDIYGEILQEGEDMDYYIVTGENSFNARQYHFQSSWLPS
jgi:hypothetical protein